MGMNVFRNESDEALAEIAMLAAERGFNEPVILTSPSGVRINRNSRVLDYIGMVMDQAKDKPRSEVHRADRVLIIVAVEMIEKAGGARNPDFAEAKALAERMSAKDDA